VGGVVELDIHTHVREDQLTLYGFILPGEREAFRHLIGVSGIGPRLAINILSGIHVSELAVALTHGDAKRLQAIPGVGRKTAERMIIDLKDRLKTNAFDGVEPPSTKVKSSRREMFGDLELALSGLGYKKGEIDKVLKEPSLHRMIRLEDAIKEALRLLGPGA